MTKDLTPKDTITNEFNVLFPKMPDESSLLVICQRSEYSASLLARAVEDCNAQVLNLNITTLDAGANEVVVALRINHRNPEPVVRSLQRYGFEVLDVASSASEYGDSMRSRANEVLKYLEM